MQEQNLRTEEHSIARSKSSAKLQGELTIKQLLDAIEDGSTFSQTYPHAFLVISKQGDYEVGSLPSVHMTDMVFRIRSLEQKTLFDGIKLGRDEHSDVIIDNPAISRKHLVFQRDINTFNYVVVDRGSSNGTRINGAKLSKDKIYPIQSKSLIRIAALNFIFLTSEDMLNSIKQSHITHKAL